jgi:ABC-type polysaccharide/polyol phosphate export permease
MKYKKREEISHFLELLLEMTKKELLARYKYTILGFFWLVANPLLQMLVIGFVFQFFIKEPIPNYYFHLFIGLLVWNFFSLSLSKATPSIVFERSLIKKAAFPREVIPLSIILSNFIHLLIAFGLYLIPLLFIHTMTFMGIVLSFVALLLLFIFTTGFSLLSTALNVRYRDVNFFVQALLIIWFYATPIVYSLSLIPRNLLWLWRFNPLTSIIQLFQYGLLAEAAPGPGMMIANLIVIVAVTACGIAVFRRESKYFDDWV